MNRNLAQSSFVTELDGCLEAQHFCIQAVSSSSCFFHEHHKMWPCRLRYLKGIFLKNMKNEKSKSVT